jgi:hypothetical protein
MTSVVVGLPSRQGPGLALVSATISFDLMVAPPTTGELFGGGELAVRDGVGDVVALGVGERRGVGESDGDAEADTDADTEGEGDTDGGDEGDVEPFTGGVGCPAPHVSASPDGLSSVPSRVTLPAESFTPSQPTEYDAAPTFCVNAPEDVTRSASGTNADDVPDVYASSLPASIASEPAGAIGRPTDDSGPTVSRDPPQRTV